VNELAKMLLKQDESWIINRASSCDKGEESRVKLKVKMRIVIVYTTAWVNSRGMVEIRDDIYNKDK
jgi:murein L,D-transpeptidase YcbB/YkuD